MYAIELSWNDENGVYRSVVTDKVVCTIGSDNEIHYTGKQLITGKVFDVTKCSAYMTDTLVNIGTDF